MGRNVTNRLELCGSAAERLAGGSGSLLRYAAESYAQHRNLSERQWRILWFHLLGGTDKSIAVTLGCRPTTIYAHWQRMAKKANCRYKSEVVSDFHHFLNEPALLVAVSTATDALPADVRDGPVSARGLPA